MGPETAQTKSRTQTPLINTARPRPSPNAYGHYESHPKLFLRLSDENAIREVYQDAVANSGKDHEGDAIVAAWCAAMGHNQKWIFNLYADIEDDIELVVPGARYPWFEDLQNF